MTRPLAMRCAGRHISATAVVVGALLATGCEADATDIAHHSGGDTRITSKVGQRFTIDVEENGSTGERWQLISPKPSASVVRESGQRLEGADPELTGAGGQRIFTFESVGAGTTQIVLLHCPEANACDGDGVSPTPQPSATSEHVRAQRVTYTITVE